jgi:hypothetical protein
MDPTDARRRFLSRVVEAVKAASARLRPPKPRMIGAPVSAWQIPTDAAEHAVDFSTRYADPMDYHVTQRMMDLGIPIEQIGASAPGTTHAAFWPHERTGGGNVPGGRLTVDSGVFNPELFKDLGSGVSSRWEKSRLRDRMDAIIAHEFTEAQGAGHYEAIKTAADTELPISDKARHLLRDIAKGGRER